MKFTKYKKAMNHRKALDPGMLSVLSQMDPVVAERLKKTMMAEYNAAMSGAIAEGISQSLSAKRL